MPERTLNTDEQFSSPLFNLTSDEQPIDCLLYAANLIQNLATTQVIDQETFGSLLYAIGDMISEQAHELEGMEEKLKPQQPTPRKTASTSGIDVSCELSTIQQKIAFLSGSLIKHPDTLEPGEVEGLGATLADIQQDVADVEQKLYPS